jgi:hypothetical protein
MSKNIVDALERTRIPRESARFINICTRSSGWEVSDLAGKVVKHIEAFGTDDVRRDRKTTHTCNVDEHLIISQHA